MNFVKIFDEIFGGKVASDHNTILPMFSSMIMNNYDNEELATEFKISVGKFGSDKKSIFPYITMKLDNPKVRILHDKYLSIKDRNISVLGLDNTNLSHIYNFTIIKAVSDTVNDWGNIQPEYAAYIIAFSDKQNKLDYQITIKVFTEYGVKRKRMSVSC